MAVHTSMLEIDASTSVLAHDYLQLIVPSVCASSDLNAAVDHRRATEHVHTKIRTAQWFRVVEAEDVQGGIHDVQAVAVVGALVFANEFAQARPSFPIFGAQNANCAFSSFTDGNLLGIVNDRLQIKTDVLFGHDKIVVVVQTIEPIELSSTQHSNVFGAWILPNMTSVVSRDACCTKHS